MKIHKVAVGNNEEAFIEDSFGDGVNIISSDDNNKGKTIVIQSMMYALGNEPIFPNTFDYKTYYHYIEFEIDNTIYYLCRYNDNFVLKYNSVLMVLDSVSELKRYWTKHIFHFPTIIKNQISKIVDPVLFWQLFFIGQDKKDTSNILYSGFYNKQDFLNMLFDLCDASGIELNDEEISKIKAELKSLKEEKESIKKQYKILKSKKVAVSYLSSTTDKAQFEQKINDLEKIRSKIEELRKARNIAATRKSKWETTIKELRSLNRTIESGELRCMDCNSTNILYSSSKKSGCSFDVSTVEIRNEILSSIEEKIDTYSEEIENLSFQINTAQDELETAMSDESISLESIVSYKKDIFNAADAEHKIQEIEKKISDLNTQIAVANNTAVSTKEKQTATIKLLVETMNDMYKHIDSSGNIKINSLFTKRDETYSGSEATIFHLIKLLSFKKLLNHSYPIIIDSFRAEDLSTIKEESIIDEFIKINNQVILTTTLKQEEFGKYNNMEEINHIDYSSHTPSKLLSPSNADNFKLLLSNLSIKH